MKKIVIILILLLTYYPLHYSIIRQEVSYIDEIMKERTSLTLENVMKEILINNIKFSDIVISQVILETGYLTSRKAIEDNNLFGYYSNKSMIFNNWMESVKYYKEWQDKYYRGGDYYTFLSKIGYAEDLNYINKLKSLIIKTK